MYLEIGWPQAIYLFFLAATIGVRLSLYGEPRLEKYGIGDVLIAPGVVLGLLYWGGFFG